MDKEYLRKRREFTIGLFLIIFLLVAGIGWVKNLIKLTQCDFEAPYKAEVMHIIGMAPPFGAIIGYMDFEQ